MGGGRLTPFFEEESIISREVQYDENRLYELQANPEFWLNAGITYKVNKPKSTRTWGLDFQNAWLTAQQAGYQYNFREDRIDKEEVFFILPNFYYKIEF